VGSLARQNRSSRPPGLSQKHVYPEPGHIEYAATKFGLGEYDKNRIKVESLEV